MGFHPQGKAPVTPITERSLAKQRLRLWLQMLKAVRLVENDLRDRLRGGYNTTLPRFDVMAALYAAPNGLKMTELSHQLMVSNGNVTGIVDRLVEDGLVERETVESDRRAFLVKMTETGRQKMHEMAEEHLAWINDLLGDVSESDTARAISIMLDIRHKVQNEAGG